MGFLCANQNMSSKLLDHRPKINLVDLFFIMASFSLLIIRCKAELSPTTMSPSDEILPTVIDTYYNESSAGEVSTTTQGTLVDKTEVDVHVPYGKSDEEEASSDDIVSRFLKLVDEIEQDKANCKKGTWEDRLPMGTVSYGPILYKEQAFKTVDFANLYTRLWKNLVIDEVEGGENFFYSTVASLVENDDKIFAAGSCHDHLRFGNYTVFCPYAYRKPDGTINVKDLSLEYQYLEQNSEWFYEARLKGQQVAADQNSRNSRVTYTFRYNQSEHGETVDSDSLLVRYEDGHWSSPYFDCGGGDIWMMTYTVPFLGYDENGSYFFKGTSGVDIDLRVIDINQCPSENESASEVDNIFADSARCHKDSEKCVHIQGRGFSRGSYKCVCREGFFFPDLSVPPELRYYNGTDIEHHYTQMDSGLDNDYEKMVCLKCGVGCNVCVDGRSCMFEHNWILRTTLLLIQCTVTICLLPLLMFTIYFREVKVVKAASPVLLRIILLGGLLLYCPVLVSYSSPTDFNCAAMQWFKEIGFATMFGALLLKTWRISVVFRVRSAARVRITDVDLIKRLGLIISGFALYLIVRMAVSTPRVKEGISLEKLKTYQCHYDWWDYAANIAELLLLLWGVRLCYVVRKAPSEFNESRFISWAIYNETLITLFHTIAIIFLQDLANPDVLYLIWFLFSQLTTTIVLALLFGSKIHLVLQGKGDKTDHRTMGGTSIGFRQRTWDREANSTSSQGLMTFEGKSLNQLDMQEELRRLYTQLELLKTKNMVAGNPHLSKKLTAMAEAARATEQILMDSETTTSTCPLETTYMLNGSGRITKVGNGDWT
ncbi:hypothetical protein HOLleu_12603 [Holothuria leucospilota]|uniref:G-protein coupled receptors family 3 profile domain-containing protein n=1 Tax=Holothuria leucospilota TaxID=206669 RepID=A0A9Q1HA87_HOLLE|nr:hypothetical protein HOLleu_12603 [Holothuria leucospilota]